MVAFTENGFVESSYNELTVAQRSRWNAFFCSQKGFDFLSVNRKLRQLS